MKTNKDGYTIRNNIIYVQGSIDKKFKRYSTGKEANKINLLWVKKNAFDELQRRYEESQNIKITSNNFVSFALNILSINSVNREKSTNDEYLSVFNKYIKNAFKNYDVQDIKKNDLQVWQNKMLDEPISIGRIIFVRAVFTGIMKEAVYDERIDKNPFSLVKVPERKELVENSKESIYPFSLDEIGSIIDASTGQNKNIITSLFFTGMRTGELWGLKWSDINFKSKTIHIQRAIRHGVIGTPKTKNSERVIDMLPIVEEALNRQKSFTYIKDSFIFLNRNKEHFRDANKISSGYWKNTLKLCGIDYRVLYQTRHSFATLMISKGEDIVWTSKTLGHANVRITLETYTKYIPNQKKERATFLAEFKQKNCTKTAHPFKDIERFAQ